MRAFILLKMSIFSKNFLVYVATKKILNTDNINSNSNNRYFM